MYILASFIGFYCTMHFRAKLGIAIAWCPSVCLSVCLWRWWNSTT